MIFRERINDVSDAFINRGRTQRNYEGMNL